jgi:hypothetical protein
MKFFSISKNQATVFLTLLVMICLGAGYFFIYIPQNEKTIQEQRFRALQNIDKNVHAKIENSVALLNNLLTDYQENKTGRDALERYIKQYPKDNFTLFVPGTVHDSLVKQDDAVDNAYTINVDSSSRRITLVFTKLNKEFDKDTQIKAHSIQMKFSFEQFIRFLLPGNIFDQYIIFSHGRPIYESFPAGISYIKEDTLLSFKKGIGSSGLITHSISGTEYKMFLQPVGFGSSTEWVIAGLLSNERFQKEKNQLPTPAVLLLLVVVLIILVTFPLLKLYQMGNKDRLTVTDGVSTIAISMLLVSLLFFMFLKYSVPLRPDDRNNSKEVLANGIIDAFKQETSKAYATLDSLDALLDPQKLLRHDIRKLHDRMEFADKGKLPDSAKTKISQLVSGKSIKQVFWLDEKGKETINWTKDSLNAPDGDFSSRQYFVSIKKGQGYLLNNDIDKPYYLGQVISWTSNDFISILSKKSVSSGAYLAAMSFDMRSLDTVMLPTGYQFAMIARDGKVLYHSEKSRNLNEVLLEEFSNSNDLRSCLEAQTGDDFRTRYFGKDYFITVKPVNGLPYYLVIFADAAYKETRDMEVFSFTFSMMLLMFAFIALQLVCTFLISAKRSFFKKQHLDTSWVGPKKSCHKEYVASACLNMIIIMLLWIFIHHTSFLAYLLTLLFSVSFVSLFLNILLATRYKKEGRTSYPFKKNAVICLCIFIGAIDIAGIALLETGNLIYLAAYEVTIGFVAIMFYKQQDILFNAMRRIRNNSLFKRWRYVHSFSFMGLTRLIITSGIPVMFFYISAYNYEQNLSIRYKHIQFADRLADKNIVSKAVYIDSNWIASIDTTESKKKRVADTTKEKKYATNLLHLFHLNLTDNAVYSAKFYTPVAADSSFFFNGLFSDACEQGCGTATWRQLSPDSSLLLKSANMNYTSPTLFSGDYFMRGLLFWALLVLALVAFYFILTGIIKKLFALNLPNLNLWKDLDDHILTNEELNNMIFIIGLPGSGKLSRVLKAINEKKINNNGTAFVYDKNTPDLNNVFIADLINIPDSGNEKEDESAWTELTDKVFASKNRLIIVNHFEYNVQDARTNRLKINFLERLMVENKCKIIILSTIHPVAFLDSVVNQTVQLTEKSIPGQDLERWHILLGHFRIVLMPLQYNKPSDTTVAWQKAMEKETSRTHFLNDIRSSVIATAGNTDPETLSANTDEMIFKLQLTSHHFYTYVWQSLTNEEKFLLYDLAEDDLVNSFDDYNMSMLIGKGVITADADGTFRLFSKGFRNFILTAIGNSEARKIQNRIKDNGNWGKLKGPLIVVMVAILTFLLASQEEAYSKLITYVAALGAGIPTVLKLFSFFDKSPQKE